VKDMPVRHKDIKKCSIKLTAEPKKIINKITILIWKILKIK